MQIHLGDVVAPVVVATLFIIATSAFKEPQRRNFNVIMIAGVGAAYFNGGLGPGSLRSLRLSPIVPTRASTHIAASALAGSSIRLGHHASPVWEPDCAFRPNVLCRSAATS
jgi:hypothetical protein